MKRQNKKQEPVSLFYSCLFVFIRGQPLFCQPFLHFAFDEVGHKAAVDLLDHVGGEAFAFGPLAADLHHRGLPFGRRNVLFAGLEAGGGVANALYGSGLIVGLATVFAVPVGLLAAVLLAEYRTARLAAPVRFIAELLGGVPSIVIGIYAYAVIVLPMKSFSAWAGAFADRVAFAGVGFRPHSTTADRTEFLGRNGSSAAPAALSRVGLSGRVGSTLDPCAAIMTEITLSPGQSEEVTFVLGEAETPSEMRRAS